MRLRTSLRVWFGFCTTQAMVAVMSDDKSVQGRVLDGMATALLLFDDRLRLEYINPAGENLFSVSARHLLGQPFHALIDEEEGLARQIRGVLEEQHPLTRHEVALGLGNQPRAMFDLTALPLLDPGQPQELLLELHPVNRLLQIAREEGKLAQERTTREILRGLAHEVKNPLGGLRGAAQLLERQLDSEELQEYTQVIIDEADRLQTLMDRMLGPMRLPRLAPLNIHAVLERVLRLMQAEERGGVRLERDYDPSIPEVLGDADQLVQALLNIVRNARQAVDDQTGRITLRTRIERMCTIGRQRHALAARIEVIDNGPGIPEEMQERVFFPMVTGRADGTGLGLSIAQNIVQQHEGAITLHSVPGRTVFTILLPIQ